MIELAWMAVSGLLTIAVIYASLLGRHHKACKDNAGLSIPGGEPGYAPGNCWVFNRKGLK